MFKIKKSKLQLYLISSFVISALTSSNILAIEEPIGCTLLRGLINWGLNSIVAYSDKNSKEEHERKMRQQQDRKLKREIEMKVRREYQEKERIRKITCQIRQKIKQQYEAKNKIEQARKRKAAANSKK